MAHRSYEVAGVQFGVRTNAEGVADWLDGTFGDFEVDDQTAPYYSIVFGASENGNVGTAFHVLYEESRALVRTLDLRAVADVLIGQFEHVAASERSDAVFLDSAAVRLGDVLALVPPIVPPYLANLSRRVVDRTGLKLPGTTYVALELGSGRLIPTTPTLDIPGGAADALAELAPHKRREELARIEEPRWADLVVFIGMAEEPIRPYSQGRAAHLLATRILNIDQVSGRGLETVAAAVREAPSYEMRSTSVDETLGTLVELLSAPTPTQ